MNEYLAKQIEKAFDNIPGDGRDHLAERDEDVPEDKEVAFEPGEAAPPTPQGVPAAANDDDLCSILWWRENCRTGLGPW